MFCASPTLSANGCFGKRVPPGTVGDVFFFSPISSPLKKGRLIASAADGNGGQKGGRQILVLCYRKGVWDKRQDSVKGCSQLATVLSYHAPGDTLVGTAASILTLHVCLWGISLGMECSSAADTLLQREGAYLHGTAWESVQGTEM